jgi:hypothetical protein
MTTTQIEADAAEFRDWLDGFPLTKTSKDLIAAKAAEIFGRKHDGGAGVMVDEIGQAIVRHTNPTNSGEPQGWYITNKMRTHEMRRDGKWHKGFDPSCVWKTEVEAEAFLATHADQPTK